NRRTITWREAYRERIEWGRVFAETRVAAVGFGRRLLYAAGAPALPALLLLRVLKHMLRQRRAPWRIIQTMTIAGVLLTGWALGELIGYVAGAPQVASRQAQIKGVAG